MRCIASSSWPPQSQRNEPRVSPVKHCEWMRSSGAPSHTSPRISAYAVSGGAPSATARSYPRISNAPHFVGSRAEATSRGDLVSVRSMTMLHLRTRRSARLHTLLRAGDRAGRLQALDLAGVESQLLQDLVVVLTEVGRTPRRHLRRLRDRHRAVHRVTGRGAAVVDAHHDVVREELRILDDLLGDLHDAVGQPRPVEHRLPVRERARAEEAVELDDERGGVGVAALHVDEPGVLLQPRVADRLCESGPRLFLLSGPE